MKHLPSDHPRTAPEARQIDSVCAAVAILRKWEQEDICICLFLYCFCLNGSLSVFLGSWSLWLPCWQSVVFRVWLVRISKDKYMCAYRCKRFQYGTLALTEARNEDAEEIDLCYYMRRSDFQVKTSTGNNCSGWEHVAQDWFGIEIEWVNLLYWVSLMPASVTAGWVLQQVSVEVQFW